LRVGPKDHCVACMMTIVSPPMTENRMVPEMRVGQFHVDLTTGEIRGLSGRVSRLAPQPCKILGLLIARKGLLMTRAEIREQIWGAKTFVDFDKAVAFCIRQIRMAFGDHGKRARYVETLRGRGFRLVAPVYSGFAAPGLERISVSSAKLAVLPLENRSGDPRHDYLASGLTDLLATELGGLSGIRVVSCTSTKAYKRSDEPLGETARRLGAAFVVEGSIVNINSKISVDVRLVEAQKDELVWARSYDGNYRGISLRRRQVASAVAENVPARSRGPDAAISSPKMGDAGALDAYARGRFYCKQWTEEGLLRSVDCFRDAVQREPTCASAYAGLASAYTLLASFGVRHPKALCRLAKGAAVRALELEDTLAEAHAILGWLAGIHDWNWPEAGRRLQRALELNDADITSNFYYAFYLAVTGEYDHALQIMEVAKVHDPLSSNIGTDLGWLYLSARHVRRALEELKHAYELDPRFAVLHYWLGIAHVCREDYQEGIKHLRMGVQLSPKSPQMTAGLGYAYARAGKNQRAREIVGKLEELSTRRYVSPCELASIHLALGQQKQALGLLRKARAGRDSWLAFLKLDPRFDGLLLEANHLQLLGRRY